MKLDTLLLSVFGAECHSKNRMLKYVNVILDPIISTSCFIPPFLLTLLRSFFPPEPSTCTETAGGFVPLERDLALSIGIKHKSLLVLHYIITISLPGSLYHRPDSLHANEHQAPRGEISGFQNR